MEEIFEDVNEKSFENKVTEAYEKGFNANPDFTIAANLIAREIQKIKAKKIIEEKSADNDKNKNNNNEKTNFEGTINKEKNNKEPEDYLEML